VNAGSAVEKIIQKAPQFINVPKDDGFTPLHVAVVNGCIKTATVLIETVTTVCCLP